MPRLTAVRSTTRDTSSGRFLQGNPGPRVRLLELSPSEVDPRVRPYLERAQLRYAGAKTSGLYKRTGSRLDGLLRSCLLLELQAELLSDEALRLPPKDARELYAEARTAMKESRAALAKLVALVGIRRGDVGEAADPLARLAKEMSEGGDDEQD